MFPFCRFCLCEDEQILHLITNLLDDDFSLESIDRFTGIQLNLVEHSLYAVCWECYEKLKHSSAFRERCLSNVALFEQLYSTVQYEVLKDAPYETLHQSEPTAKVEQLEIEIMRNNETSANEAVFTGRESEEEPVSVPFNPQMDLEEEELTEDYDDDYSANYIIQDVLTYDQEEDDEAFFNPPGADKPPKQTKPKRNPADATIENGGSGGTQSGTSASRPKKLCPICGKLVNNLPMHQASHSKVANYACPHCPTRMTDPANMMRHIQAVHQKKIVISCELCGQGFTHKNVYISHMRAKHEIGKLYKCEECAKVFRYPNGLRDHMKRFHRTDCSYKCATCDKTFKTSQSLKAHGNVHSTNKPYSCQYCPKQFKSRTAKAAHQLTHSGIQFVCKFCSRPYRYKIQLMSHIRKNHPEGAADEQK